MKDDNRLSVKINFEENCPDIRSVCIKWWRGSEWRREQRVSSGRKERKGENLFRAGKYWLDDEWDDWVSVCWSVCFWFRKSKPYSCLNQIGQEKRQTGSKSNFESNKNKVQLLDAFVVNFYLFSWISVIFYRNWNSYCHFFFLPFFLCWWYYMVVMTNPHTHRPTKTPLQAW